MYGDINKDWHVQARRWVLLVVGLICFIILFICLMVQSFSTPASMEDHRMGLYKDCLYDPGTGDIRKGASQENCYNAIYNDAK